MRNSRREFLQTSSALAAGLMGMSHLPAHAGTAPEQAKPGPDTAEPIPIPKIKFGGVEIGRMVLGVNPFYGWAHYNQNFASSMTEWYTQERVCAVMRRANSFGINAFNYVNLGRAPSDLARFQAEGGRMHLIIQVTAKDDPAALVQNLKPLALQRRGEEVDLAFQNGTMAAEKDWCKRARDLGVLVGVGTHKPEVIETIEEQGWDVDFYAGCVYNRTRTESEWKKMLNGELPEMPREIYVQSDPPRMYKVMRQTSKTCFAFKILAAGRVADADVPKAFRAAFENIKPGDGIYVGYYPRRKDELGENAQIVRGILAGA